MKFTNWFYNNNNNIKDITQNYINMNLSTYNQQNTHIFNFFFRIQRCHFECVSFCRRGRQMQERGVGKTYKNEQKHRKHIVLNQKWSHKEVINSIARLKS